MPGFPSTIIRPCVNCWRVNHALPCPYFPCFGVVGKSPPPFPCPPKRYALFGVAALVGGSFFLPPMLNLHLEGLVDGDLIPVGPMYRARIDQPMVSCDTKVSAGQPLVRVSNFMLAGQYAQAATEARQAMALAESDREAGVAAASAAAAAAAQTARAQAANAAKLANLYQANQRLYDAQAIGRVALDTSRSEWQQAQAQAAAAAAAARQSSQELERLRQAADTRANAAGSELALQESLHRSVSDQVLSAPVSGEVLDCHARPGDAVEAGTSLYKIFQPDQAYITAFLPPDDAARVRAGMSAYVDIPGLGEVSGRVLSVRSEMSQLPETLTRYFWEHKQWTQYRPVRVGFDTLSSAQRHQLLYGGRVAVRIPLHSWTS